MIRTSLSQVFRMIPQNFSNPVPSGVTSIALSSIRFCTEGQLSESDLKAHRFIQIGDLSGKNHWEKALEAFHKAINVEEGSDNVKALAYNNAGTIRYELKEHAEALDCYQKAVDLAKKESSDYQIFEKNLENQKTVLEAAQIDAKNEITDPAFQANQLGIGCQEKGQYALAIDEFKKAISALDGEVVEKEHLNTIKGNLANAYFSHGDELKSGDKNVAAQNFAASLILNNSLENKSHEMEGCVSQIPDCLKDSGSKIFCLELLNEKNEQTNFVDSLNGENSTEVLKQLMKDAQSLIDSSVGGS